MLDFHPVCAHSRCARFLWQVRIRPHRESYAKGRRAPGAAPLSMLAAVHCVGVVVLAGGGGEARAEGSALGRCQPGSRTSARDSRVGDAALPRGLQASLSPGPRRAPRGVFSSPQRDGLQNQRRRAALQARRILCASCVSVRCFGWLPCGIREIL